MAFRISASLGDEKPFFRITCRAPPGREHVEVLIDDKSIHREHASRLLRAMADRLQECNWPPDEACGFESPRRSGKSFRSRVNFQSLARSASAIDRTL